ncbi:MAG: serine/threonine protein kinase [Planctomycetes bacterium]|nr:serine/threonine protein kinase [Planctomycetota bacterium]
MNQVIEALIDETGRIFLTEPVQTTVKRRALVIVLDDETLVGPYQGKTFVPNAPPRESNSRYRIERPLAAGGMGQAFVGTDDQTGRKVCIKRLRPDTQSEILVQEWRSLSRVDSRYVVRFLDQYEQDGSLHLVMDYVEGPTLADRLEAGLPPTEVGWLALALMRGLQSFHQLDVIHCDLKPQNVLIEQETFDSPGEPGWVPKIIDFGLAVLDRHDADGQLTAVGRVAGTPVYMAPEQVNGWMLSPACDVYSVGLILYEALTGQRAFTGPAHSIMQAKREQRAGLRVGRLPAGAPFAIDDFVELCSHPDPARRPTSAEAVRWLEQNQRFDSRQGP